MRIVITGANRGIGLELTSQYLGRGEQIFAACRNPTDAGDLQALKQEYPDRLTVIEMDVTRQESIDRAYERVAELTPAVDLLINNAGRTIRGERPGTLDAETMHGIFAVNTFGPMIVSQRFLDLLTEGNSPKIVNITSQLGSLARKSSGGLYSYCASKAALNMMSKALAYDLEKTGITVVMVHPGWVQTDMGGTHATLTPAESVSGIIGLIDGLTQADSARFLQWDGRELPW